MRCGSCDENIADASFSYCPRCGVKINAQPEPTEAQNQARAPQAQPLAKILAGTWVLGAFSAISFLVSVVHGLIPIYLMESAAWAGVAWFWQKKTHSETANIIVIVAGIVVGIGEVAHIVRHWNDNEVRPSTSITLPVTPSDTVATVTQSVPPPIALESASKSSSPVQSRISNSANPGSVPSGRNSKHSITSVADSGSGEKESRNSSG